MCCHPHIHLSGWQGDAADQNLRARQKKANMKKQFASRRAPPGQPVPNPYDTFDEETLEGGEGDSEEDGSTEGDEEPGDNLPRLKDIAQVLFFDFPCICFGLVCIQHSFLPQVPGDRHEQSSYRLGFLDTVISFLFVCVIDSQFFALTNYMMVGEQAGVPFEEGAQLRPQLRPNYGH
jgi:hypothetical protein